MGRIALKRLDELEALLKDEEHVEIIIIDAKTEEVLRTVESRKRATIRLLIRI